MLEAVFNPKSICVIGATKNPKKFGNAVTMNILDNPTKNYDVYLVSHGSTKIYDKKVYKSILDIDTSIELAIILVPAKIVENVVDQCIQKPVKAIIIVTAGFGEMNEEGKIIEKQLANKCRRANIRVIGPNCVGIENTAIDLNASFIQKPLMGNISMITQSGSFGAACIWEWNEINLGLAKFANIGNAIDVSFTDVLAYYHQDPHTKVIAVYLESVQDGRAFYEAIKRISKDKPVVVLKGGRNPTGLAAASSHTGSLASNYHLLKTAVEQAGGIVCENMRDYSIALQTFSTLPIPQGENIAVLTSSGGTAVLFSDFAEELGLRLPSFSNQLIENIQPHVLSLVKIQNPLDMIASANEKTFYNVSKILLEDPDLDIVVPCSLVPPFMGQDPESHMRGAVQAWKETGNQKPIIPLMVFSEGFSELKDLQQKYGIPLYFTPQEAAKAALYLIRRFRYLKTENMKE